MNRLSCENSGDLARADEILGRGGLVAVPSETVYGLAADARNERSVRRIFETKGRPLIDPLIVHLHHPDLISLYCEIPNLLAPLANAFWPGPLTIVLPYRHGSLSPLVSAGLATLAVRIPSHPVLRKLLAIQNRPLAAPSANPFGYISPTRARHVIDSLGERLDAVLDGGPCEHGVESTILSLADPLDPVLLRPGPTPLEALAKVIGTTPRVKDCLNEPKNPEAPGMLASHYSPSKPLHAIPEGRMEESQTQKGVARLYMKRPYAHGEAADTFWLSENGDSTEIARNLFELLRKLDADPTIKTIRMEYPSGREGLNRAIYDRMQRAAHKMQMEVS